jgi:hypothetical protein
VPGETEAIQSTFPLESTIPAESTVPAATPEPQDQDDSEESDVNIPLVAVGVVLMVVVCALFAFLVYREKRVKDKHEIGDLAPGQTDGEHEGDGEQASGTHDNSAMDKGDGTAGKDQGLDKGKIEGLYNADERYEGEGEF